MTNKPLLLVGGSGVYGTKLAKLVRKRNPNLRLAIGGRDLAKAGALAEALGNAEGVAIDMNSPGLGLGTGDFCAVGLIAHDPTLHVIDFASRNGVPYLGIAGAAFELCVDALTGLRASRTAPLVMASHWFAGAVTLPVLALAERFNSIDTVEVDIVIDRGISPKGAGAATLADFARIGANCNTTVVRKDGRYVWLPAEKTNGRFRRADGVEVDAVGSASPDVISIGAATGARNIRILEGFTMSASRAAGGPASDEIYIRISGEPNAGGKRWMTQTLSCAREPYSFTAISVAILLEQISGITDGSPLAPGLYMPEHTIEPAAFVRQMKNEGVIFSEA